MFKSLFTLLAFPLSPKFGKKKRRFAEPSFFLDFTFFYHSYGCLLDECIASVVCKASNGSVIIDTDYKKIFCIGEYVSFRDLKGTEHKLKFAWFLSPELKELKEYFANYKKVNRLQQIDKCKDDIERYKKRILESEETIKKLEEEEDCVESQV